MSMAKLLFLLMYKSMYTSRMLITFKTMTSSADQLTHGLQHTTNIDRTPTIVIDPQDNHSFVISSFSFCCHFFSFCSLFHHHHNSSCDSRNDDSTWTDHSCNEAEDSSWGNIPSTRNHNISNRQHTTDNTLGMALSTEIK